MRWQLHTQDNFMKKSPIPFAPILPKIETLEGCVKGLSKKMKTAKTTDEYQRMKIIRDEISSLIDAL